MNPESVRPTPHIPLPKGLEHEAWVYDVTPLSWLRRTWTPQTSPYKYSRAGQVVRKAMPTSGLVRYPRLLIRLINYVQRDRQALSEEFKLPDNWTDEDVAVWLIAKVLVERDTTFVVYNIQPNGRTVMFLRMHAFWAWHPDSPDRGEY